MYKDTLAVILPPGYFRLRVATRAAEGARQIVEVHCVVFDGNIQEIPHALPQNNLAVARIIPSCRCAPEIPVAQISISLVGAD